MIIGQLLSKKGSANSDSNSNFRSQAIAKDSQSNVDGEKATEEAAAPQEETPVAERPSKSQKSLQLKSQKNQQEEEPAKQADPSEDADFIDYDDDFGDAFDAEPTDEGIKVSSSDIEPVSRNFTLIF